MSAELAVDGGTSHAQEYSQLDATGNVSGYRGPEGGFVDMVAAKDASTRTDGSRLAPTLHDAQAARKGRRVSYEVSTRGGFFFGREQLTRVPRIAVSACVVAGGIANEILKHLLVARLLALAERASHVVSIWETEPVWGQSFSLPFFFD